MGALECKFYLGSGRKLARVSTCSSIVIIVSGSFEVLRPLGTLVGWGKFCAARGSVAGGEEDKSDIWVMS